MVVPYPRLLGLALLAAAGGSTLAHRLVYLSARHGPAQAAELGLGLLTFTLASLGMLLVINGGVLFGRPDGRVPGRRTAQRRRRPFLPPRR